jgi:hypothetical protein
MVYNRDPNDEVSIPFRELMSWKGSDLSRTGSAA